MEWYLGACTLVTVTEVHEGTSRRGLAFQNREMEDLHHKPSTSSTVEVGNGMHCEWLQ